MFYTHNNSAYFKYRPKHAPPERDETSMQKNDNNLVQLKVNYIQCFSITNTYARTV